MEIDVKTALVRHDGKAFQTATGFVETVDDKGKATREPILEDLRLGVLMIESLSMQKQGEHVSAVDMVKRDVLARRIYDALENSSGHISITTDQQTFLKRQIELLVSQGGYSVFAAASALQMIAPDDFKDD